MSLRLERAAALLLLLAFLPTLSFLGHWDEIVTSAQVVPAPASVLIDAAAQRAAQADHARHCHTDLASCSAQPIAAGLGLFASRETFLRPPRPQLAFDMAEQTRTLLGRTLSPAPPPPRHSS